MTNLKNEILHYLNQHVDIKRCLSYGIINTRALADYIRKENNFNFSLDAIISTLRRIDMEQYQNIFSQSQKIMKDKIESISTRSNLSQIVIKNNIDIFNKIPNISSIIENEYEDITRILQSDKTIKIITNEYNLNKMKKIFDVDEIKTTINSISEINLHFKNLDHQKPGIIAAIANELAMNEINIIDIVTCAPGLICYISQKDLLTAYNAIYKLFFIENKIKNKG